MVERAPDPEERLTALVRDSPLLMLALRAARAVDPPDWLIGAGAIRECVWAHLHGIAQPAPRDVDLAFFDSASLEPGREKEVHAALTADAPEIPWEVTNQAAVHLWYPRVHGLDVRPLTSSADGIATWPETATAIGVRLMPDDSLRVVAPCGLDDLLGLVWRHNPRRATAAMYRRRTEEKRIAERWPRVRIVDATG